MEFTQIPLTADDDIVSICDRLDWARTERVLLILPAVGNVLTEQVDLARLRRHADKLRLEVGLMTLDPHTAALAKPLGFPTFRSAAQAADNERRWRRGRHRREKAGMTREEVRRTLLGRADREEVSRRLRPPATWQRWLLRYTAILLFCLVLAALYVAIAYTVPGATITLRPTTETVRVTKQIVADPQLEAVSFSGASVPARVITVSETWQAEVATTGTTLVADAPARGTVLFVNKTAETVRVPAGTKVIASAGQRIVFQTLQDVEVPNVLGATAEAAVVAAEAGEQGNVPANQINQIEGALALALDVRNVEPLEGGAIREVSAVAEADLERLRAQVTQYIQTLSLSQMESQLRPNEFLAQDSVRVVQIFEESISDGVGAQAEVVSMVLKAEVQATAVNTQQALDLIYTELAAAVHPRFALVPESLNFYAGDVLGVDGQGRVSFEMIGEGVMAAELAVDPYLEAIAGQPTQPAMHYLYAQLPLAEVPRAHVVPNWFDRLPYLPVRMRTEIITTQSLTPDT